MRLITISLVLLLLLPLAQAQSLTEAIQECPGTLTGSSTPEQVHLQISENPDEMVVIWATNQRGDAVVEWTVDEESNSASGESYCYNHDKAFHMAVMSDLPLGKEISYRVGDGDTWSGEFSFTTINPDASRFEFIAIADHGLSAEALDVTDGIMDDKTIQMVTISGDISYADGDQSVWDEWFQAQEGSMVSVPWVTAVGNHENETGIGYEAYEHRFDSDKETESESFWYSRNVPGMHLIFMSTEHEYSIGSEQYTWLLSDLKNANTPSAREEFPFIIVFGHKPMYSSNSYHGSESNLRNAIEEMYVKYGVDLVIAGHDHFYERTWPVIAEQVADKGESEGIFVRGHAPIHLVIGIAGRSAYEELEEPQPEWSAYRENNSYGWTRLVYDDLTRQVTLTHHRINGSTGDSFTIQEKALSQETKDTNFLGLPGFDIIIMMVAIMGAAMRRCVDYGSIVGSQPEM